MRQSTRPLTLAVVLLAGGLTLSACGGGGSGSNASGGAGTPTPGGSATAGPSQTPTTLPPSVPAGGVPAHKVCGKVQMKGNEETVLRVKGAEGCKSVMAVIGAYDRAGKQNTRGAATVKGWKCRATTSAEHTKTGYITVCTKGAEEFATKLN
jgi:hypothetical protein